METHVFQVGMNLFALVFRFQLLEPRRHELGTESEDQSLEGFADLLFDLSCLFEDAFQFFPQRFLCLVDALELLPGQLPLRQHLFELGTRTGLTFDQGSDFSLGNWSEPDLDEDEVLLLDAFFELPNEFPPFLAFPFHHLIASSLELLRLEHRRHRPVQVFNQVAHVLAKRGPLPGREVQDQRPIGVVEVVHIALVPWNPGVRRHLFEDALHCGFLAGAGESLHVDVVSPRGNRESELDGFYGSILSDDVGGAGYIVSRLEAEDLRVTPPA